MKYENREVKYPEILKIMRIYYANGLLDVYFAIQNYLEKKEQEEKL